MTESTVGKRGFEPSKITIYVKNSGIVLEESSMALVNRDTGLIIAMGMRRRRLWMLRRLLLSFYQAGAKTVYLSSLPLETAVISLGEQCSVFVGITWSGKEKERFCINENCPHRIF